MARLTVVRDIASVSATAAERLASLTEGWPARHGARAISLAGGNTPRQLYECLADPAQSWRTRIDWSHVELFWGDERNVPPDHPDSNFGLANRALIRHVPIPATQVHRMRGEVPAVEAACEYEAMLRERRQAGRALFDVMLLGIGTDGHVASLFPDSPLLEGVGTSGGSTPVPPWPVTQAGSRDEPARRDGNELASGIFVASLDQWRITLTPPALLDSHAIIVIAAGLEKADAIATAIEGALEVQRHPAQLLRAAGERVEWIIDEAAARLVS
jgi:6-phosphogluconolactonase